MHELTADTHPIQREFYDFYRTPRGEFTPKGSSPELTTHPTLTSNVKFMNFYPFNDIETISPRPMLFITGDQAHSREFSEDAYKRAAEPKELFIVPGAGHVDLYDRVNLIPFDKLAVVLRSASRLSEPKGKSPMLNLLLRACVITHGLIGPSMAQERILISSDWGKATAELVDNTTTESLVQMLPLTIEMRDHLRQEKTGNLPAPLPEFERQLDFSVGTLGLLELQSLCYLLS